MTSSRSRRRAAAVPRSWSPRILELALLAGLAGSLGANPGAVVPIQSVFEQACRAPDLETAGARLEAALAAGEQIQWSARRPLADGVHQIRRAFQVDWRQMQALRLPLERLYDAYLQQVPEARLTGQDLLVLTQLRPAAEFPITLAKYGPRTYVGSRHEGEFGDDLMPGEAYEVLAYLRAGAASEPVLLAAFSALAVLTHLEQGRLPRGQLLVAELSAMAEQLPEPLRVKAFRSVVYDLAWELSHGGDAWALTWIRRAFDRPPEDEALAFTLDLISRLGRYDTVPDHPLQPSRLIPFSIPSSFLVQLAEVVPPDAFVTLVSAVSPRVDLAQGPWGGPTENLTKVLATARARGATADGLVAIEGTLLSPPGPSPDEPSGAATAWSFVETFAGYKVGKPISGRAEEGEFRLSLPAGQYGDTRIFELDEFRGGSWVRVGTIRAWYDPEHPVIQSFRPTLGWRFRSWLG